MDATALFAEVGSKRLGSLQLNVIRMSLSLLFWESHCGGLPVHLYQYTLMDVLGSGYHYQAL
jgi:hypothetical protein